MVSYSYCYLIRSLIGVLEGKGRAFRLFFLLLGG